MRFSSRPFLLLPLLLLASSLLAQAPAGTRSAAIISRFPAVEARQGVAVDQRFLYVIDNQRIGKYDKATGGKVGEWQGAANGPIHHLNAGVARDGRLYVAHSNYPELPMVSSIEIFDTETLTHLESQSFGIHSGSATWVDHYNGSWWVAFANYENAAGLPGRGVEWSTVERFDDEWRQTGGWVFPPRLVDRFRPYSNSGGKWVAGELWVTGHDAPEVYVLRLPEGGSTLEWTATIQAPIAGQGITVDPIYSKILYAIDRQRREVLVVQVD